MNASHVTGSTYSGQFSSVQFVCCEHNRHNHSTVGIGQTLRGVALCTKPIFGPGAEPPAGGPGGTAPSVGQRAKPPEADCISVLEHTFLRCPGACSGSRSDRSDQTEAYI